MATSTSKYGFKKPSENDFYSVEDQNRNWDLAEGALATKVAFKNVNFDYTATGSGQNFIITNLPSSLPSGATFIGAFCSITTGNTTRVNNIMPYMADKANGGIVATFTTAGTYRFVCTVLFSMP